MKKNVQIKKGIIWGISCFLVSIFPYLWFWTVGAMVLALGSADNIWLIGVGVILALFALPSAFLGVSVAQDSNRLKIIAIMVVISSHVALISFIVYRWFIS